MKELIIRISIIGLVSFLFISCIQTSDPEVPSRIYYLFNVENVGNVLEAGEDSIKIDEFKIVADKFNLLLSGEGKLQSQPNAIIMAYRTENDGDDEVVLSADIGYQDVNQFNGLELFISPPDDSDNIQDSDFFGDDNNYSFIFKGTFNDKDFTYKSDVSFQKDFNFSEITLTNDKRHLVIRVLSNIENVFINESNQNILNPANEENKSMIDSLAKSSLNIEVFSTERFVFD